MAKLSIRIDLAPGLRIGPGKIALLEEIARRGSLAAAARAMGMSYRRAWELVEALNRMFDGPIVAARSGGTRGGGAALTPLGETLVSRYRAMEQAATKATGAHLRALARSGNTRKR
jgi:molybdate transport system regulatory protein